jgi:hypothetical protein
MASTAVLRIVMCMLTAALLSAVGAELGYCLLILAIIRFLELVCTLILRGGAVEPFKYEAQTALFKDTVRTAQ